MENDVGPESIFNVSGLSEAMLCRMARETGFTQRSSGKISESDLLERFCDAAVKGTVSYNDLAGTMQVATGLSVSRQAYCDRMNTPGCVAFLKAVLAHIMLLKYPAHSFVRLQAAGRFRRILIQDSTIIQLPSRLFETFSGVKNAHTTTCHARIQGVYDLCAGQFVSFSIDPYSKNDLSVAADIQTLPGDLLLRDRGYLITDLVGDLKIKGVDTISRYKHATALYDPDTRQPIKLLERLTRDGSIDQVVLAGSKLNVRIRLLAVPVREEVANLRRMKAYKENKGHAPSEELLRLMSWSIFILTIEDPTLTVHDVLDIYGLRWRIENIFKTWKSNFSFGKMHNVSAHQLTLLLVARLIVISLSYRAFDRLHSEILSSRGRQLSLMKFMRFLSLNLPLLPTLLSPCLCSTQLLDALTRYCTYDKRKRRNFQDLTDSALASLSNLRAIA